MYEETNHFNLESMTTTKSEERGFTEKMKGNYQIQKYKDA